MSLPFFGILWDPVVRSERNGFNLALRFNQLEVPTLSRIPRTYFVGSKGDVFHKAVPFGFTQLTFDVMGRCAHHSFMILTNNSDILVKHAYRLFWTKNISVGVYVQNDDYAYRIDDLRKVPAKTRFVLLEPLVGLNTDLNLDGIHRVIVGGFGWQKIVTQTKQINQD